MISVVNQVLREAVLEIGNWVSMVLSSLTEDGASLWYLLPFFVIGLSISLIFVVLRLIRKFTWGV